VGEEIPEVYPEEMDGYLLPLEEEIIRPEETLEEQIERWVRARSKGLAERLSYYEYIARERHIAQYLWALLRGPKRNLAELLYDIEMSTEWLEWILENTLHFLEEGQLTEEQIRNRFKAIKDSVDDIKRRLEEIREYRKYKP